ncbi:MAG: universal stress protein [Desulfomicrobium escambiense]|nr:universal stress protein [Desulfomicrobium escambiense]
MRGRREKERQEPYKTIIEEAKKDRVDIIVMGRRGEAGLEEDAHGEHDGQE